MLLTQQLTAVKKHQNKNYSQFYKNFKQPKTNKNTTTNNSVAIDTMINTLKHNKKKVATNSSKAAKETH